VIRRATPVDHPWLVELGAAAFASLGDYHQILPAWLGQECVSGWLAEHGGQRRGFTLIGFFRDQAGENVADLLALVVDPAWRSQGIGRALLGHAVAMAEVTARVGGLRELRLCVADDNHVGQRLYRSSGFRRLSEDVGSYPRGQRAVRMVYALASATPTIGAHSEPRVAMHSASRRGRLS
jgi:ribosomal protein S18 acetylase RimI-like enzyme